MILMPYLFLALGNFLLFPYKMRIINIYRFHSVIKVKKKTGGALSHPQPSLTINMQNVSNDRKNVSRLKENSLKVFRLFDGKIKI